MTPRAVRAQTRALGLALLLALASGNARGGELYRWETEDGRVEIGTTPPRGAAAVPWVPGQEAAAESAAKPSPAETGRAATGPEAAAKARARGLRQQQCATEKAAADKAAQRTLVLEKKIAQLESKLEELEETHLAYSRTTCRSQEIEGASSDCLTSSFHRDAEIARVQKEIELAQQKLGDLEQRARRVPPSEDCEAAAARPAAAVEE